MRRSLTRVLLLVLAIVWLAATVAADGRRFYRDDPIAREPEPADASGAKSADITLTYEVTLGLFVTAGRTPSNTRARNVNTIDEVPDSSWFTNRIGAQPLSREALLRGPNIGRPPAPEKWVVTREKTSGFAPGFTARDASGETWFVSFDPPGNPEGATAALAIANRIFWALGYNQVETFITTVDPRHLEVDPQATNRRPNGSRTPLRLDDIRQVLERARRNQDGTYRAAASRLLPGRVIGPFRYEDTRSDDPNDIVPHEHRRELRALRVFGAWTNLTDLKAGNTLDTVVTEDGRGVVKHYLQDVGSTFGIGANGPHDWDEGFEYFYQGDTSRRRLLTFGFALSPWQTARYEDHPSIGRFESERFDPLTWKPHWATTAYTELRADDAFWAARRVLAFDEETIRAIVKTGQFSDPAAEKYLADVLIQRRDKIGRAWLAPINPIVNPRLDASGALTIENAAVAARVAQAPTAYRAVWHEFDNAADTTRPLGETRSASDVIPAPSSGLPAGSDSYVRVDVSAESVEHSAWGEPVRIYFHRTGSVWKLVGLERVRETANVTVAPPARKAGR
jgi:hypothetical protein